jgi:hypothetical protein
LSEFEDRCSRLRLQTGAAAGVDQGVTLAAADPLAGVAAARLAGLGRVHAPAVEHRHRRAGPAPDPLAVGDDEGVVDPLEQAAVALRHEPAIDSGPRRQVARQLPPWPTTDGAAR